MDGTIIYDAAQAGWGKDSFGGLILFYLAWIGLAYLSLTLRSARQKGISIASRSKQTTQLREFIALNAWPILITTGILLLFMTAAVLHIHQQTEKIHGPERQARLTGVVSLYSTVVADRFKKHGVEQPYHERDQLTVGSNSFIIECDRTPELSVGMVGGRGLCLPLRGGEKIQVDYFDWEPTRPAKIMLMPP